MAFQLISGNPTKNQEKSQYPLACPFLEHVKPTLTAIKPEAVQDIMDVTADKESMRSKLII